KATAHWTTLNYRETYGIYACSGILFNHDSPLRSDRFVTKKVVAAAAEIAAGRRERVTLGRLDISRDWGYAPEYVDAMWRMLQQDAAEDFVIATGRSITLEQFVSLAFEAVGLDWRPHVDVDPGLFRPADPLKCRANPAKAARVLT